MTERRQGRQGDETIVELGQRKRFVLLTGRTIPVSNFRHGLGTIQ
jgi:hypothetical protein